MGFEKIVNGQFELFPRFFEVKISFKTYVSTSFTGLLQVV